MFAEVTGFAAQIVSDFRQVVSRLLQFTGDAFGMALIQGRLPAVEPQLEGRCALTLEETGRSGQVLVRMIPVHQLTALAEMQVGLIPDPCLLYTSDAADDLLCV